MKEKNDEIVFTTRKGLVEIANALRAAAQKTKAYDMQKIQDDVFGGLGSGPSADIEVAMIGHVGMVGGLKHFRLGSANNDWAVQAYVFDQGDCREVHLIALGEKGISMTGAGDLNLGASKEKREIVRRLIEA